MNNHIQICSFVSGWHCVDREMARKFVQNMMSHMTAIPEAEKSAYVETHYLRGITVKELMEE